ncbi:MAG: TonB-dependent receptor [Gammaproteobacteria bacterium]|nr:TonB-dependent receptor [Gammaproteobacteria bacterium]MBD3776282.1 TonB-dependent receptor [Thiotrichales bacterium]
MAHPKNDHPLKKKPLATPISTLGAMVCGMGLINPLVMAAEPSPTLSTVEVRDAAENADIRENNGYQGTTTRVGKMQQDPHDVPQALTTVTQQLMEDQQVSSLKEALRNVSGLTFNAAEGGRAGDNMMLRGFYTFGDMYLDGVRDTAQYNRETFNLEQVDVLRGSGSMLFGRGQAGGVINQVSKTPKLQDANKVSLSTGSHDYSEITGDFNKKLGDTTAARVNVMKRSQGSFRSNPENGAEADIERGGIAASLGFGLNTGNELVISHIHTVTDDNPDYGIRFVDKKPQDEMFGHFYGSPRSFDKSETDITTLTHHYKIDKNTDLRTVVRNAHYLRDYAAAKPSASDLTSDSFATRHLDVHNLALQSDITHKRMIGGVPHEMMAGIEYLHEDSKRAGLLNLSASGDPKTYSPGVITGTPTTYKGDSYSIFVQDQFEFIPDWKLLLGVRHDQLNAKYSSTNSPKLDFGEQSYRSALSWQPDEASHYYLSYSDSFSPTADLYQLDGGEFPPERSQVMELGAKWFLLDGDLTLRTALYRADKQWERSTDLEATASVLTQKRRTDGLEVEVAGRITPNWEVFAGAALMDAKILEVAPPQANRSGTIVAANPNFEGQRARNTPEYTYNLWTTYKLPHGWKVGGGLDAKGERYAYSPTSGGTGEFDPNTVPSYVRWDAMLAYEQKDYTLRLNVVNLFNTDWYESVYDNGGFVVPGSDQAYMLTGEFKF